MVSYSPQLWDIPLLGQSGARWGTEGGCSALLPGNLGVFSGSLCPKATMSHWVCFAWAISTQTPSVSPAWQSPLDSWQSDGWHWQEWP